MSSRRHFLQQVPLLSSLPAFASHPAFAADRVPSDRVPQSVGELWADFDPRSDPLEVEVIREWEEDGGVSGWCGISSALSKASPPVWRRSTVTPPGLTGRCRR